MTPRWNLLLVLAVALALGACTDEGDDTDRETGTPEADQTDEADGSSGSDERAIADARELLGTPEDEVVEDRDTRIRRRGDEEFPVTMDLRPGRRNLELEDDGSGTYVVTRVVIETADGEDLVVE